MAAAEDKSKAGHASIGARVFYSFQVFDEGDLTNLSMPIHEQSYVSYPVAGIGRGGVYPGSLMMGQVQPALPRLDNDPYLRYAGHLDSVDAYSKALEIAFREKTKELTKSLESFLASTAASIQRKIENAHDTDEMQSMALDLARTKAVLRFADELYSESQKETGMTATQQYHAFKQRQREQSQQGHSH